MPLRLSTSLAVIVCAFFGPWFAQYAGTVLLGNSKSPFSSVMGAILAGMVIGNIGLGFHALPIVLICISSALLLVTVASRAMAMSRQLAALIAVGTSICGVTAIVAMAPVIRAREAEVSYAVGCIALFGLVAMFVHPMIAHALFATQPQLAGVFLGTAVHDTSQVVGAGLMYQDQYAAGGVLEAATVTKLVRNVMMAAVIPLVAVLFQGGARQEQAAATNRRLPVVPGFVLWFIAMCALRSAVDFCEPSFGQLAKNIWISIVGDAQRLSELCLTVSMAAVGLQTRLGAFRQIGFRPLLLAMLTAAVVGGVSLLSIRFILETA